MRKTQRKACSEEIGGDGTTSGLRTACTTTGPQMILRASALDTGDPRFCGVAAA